MLAQLEATIGKVENEVASAILETRRALAENNKRLREEAASQLGQIMGDLAEELKPLIREHDPVYDQNGKIHTMQWTLAGKIVQLVPIELSWCATDIRKAIMVRFHDGQAWQTRSYVMHADAFKKLLYEARCMYPLYRERQEYASRRLAAVERGRTIDNLCYGWNRLNLEQVTSRVDALRALGESKLADEKLAEWRAAVAKKEEADRYRADYQHQLEEWHVACRTWAERETERLWERWLLWKVRYAPVGARRPFNEDLMEQLIQDVHTLDEPEDISGQTPSARVDRVNLDGSVTADFVIGWFLDAEPICFNTPSCTEPLAYHRRFHAGGSYVNVPPFVLEDPAPAPMGPEGPEGPEPLDEEVPF
jgi:hypothetical protein